MATLTLENLPDEIVEQIANLAQEQKQSINEQAIALIKQALEKSQPPLKMLISPESDPTWEDRRKATPEILKAIRQSRRVNPADFGLKDSTDLITEDRNR